MSFTKTNTKKCFPHKIKDFIPISSTRQKINNILAKHFFPHRRENDLDQTEKKHNPSHLSLRASVEKGTTPNYLHTCSAFCFVGDPTCLIEDGEDWGHHFVLFNSQSLLSAPSGSGLSSPRSILGRDLVAFAFFSWNEIIQMVHSFIKAAASP